MESVPSQGLPNPPLSVQSLLLHVASKQRHVMFGNRRKHECEAFEQQQPSTLSEQVLLQSTSMCVQSKSQLVTAQHEHSNPPICNDTEAWNNTPTNILSVT